jgi:hypothetical protein
MLAVGLVFVLLGVIMLFVIPWVGVPAGIIGLALLAVWLLGAGRRATGPQEAPKA